VTSRMTCMQHGEKTVAAILAQETGRPVDVGPRVPALNLETGD